MSPENLDAILSVLALHPAGTTAKAAAVALGWKETAASLRMGRLFNAGTIGRAPQAGRNQFLYWLKAPSIAPAVERWVPTSTLIAERAYV